MNESGEKRSGQGLDVRSWGDGIIIIIIGSVGDYFYNIIIIIIILTL